MWGSVENQPLLDHQERGDQAEDGGAALASQLDSAWNTGRGSSGGGGGGSGLHPTTALRRQRSVAEGLGLQGGALVGDAYKEAHRKDLRTVFTFALWKQHRSSQRYLRHLLGTQARLMESREPAARTCDPAASAAAFDLPSKLRALVGPLLYVLAVALCVATYHALAEAGMAPPVWRGFNIGNNAPFGFTSFALSLLLVFRTNSSYARWLDARKTWGSVVNRSRDLARQGLAYFPPEHPHLQAMLCRWTAAYSYCLMCALREDCDDEGKLSHLLPEHELHAVLVSDNRPLYVLQVLSSVIRRAQAAQEEQHPGTPLLQPWICMDANLTALEDAQGACERILRSPIPLPFTRHTSRFLIIWLTLLPFTLWESCRWAMLPLAGLIAFLLLGIEEIGVSIEEPFSILPLCHMCATIERNVAELFATHSPHNVPAGQVSTAAVSADCLVDAAAQTHHAPCPQGME